MNNSDNQYQTFEEAVKSISEQNTGDGSNPREKKFKETTKDDIDNRVPRIGFFRNL